MCNELKLAAYTAIEKYSVCINAELESKRRIAGQLAARREQLMHELDALESELNPIIDRVILLEREQSRMSGVFA